MNSELSPPIVRLRPKKSPKRFRHGDPWVFANEVVLDRRTRAIPAGSVICLADEKKVPFALGTFNPQSKIVSRILSFDLSRSIDQAWFREKLQHADALRTRLFGDPYYRLVHAEGDSLPGLIIDRFGDVFVIQPNSAWADLHLEQITSALCDVFDPGAVLKNTSGRSRTLEGLPDDPTTLFGDAPTMVHVPMNGATYVADLKAGQKTGLFFDQRDNHAFAARLAKSGTVLDVFSHVGGFGLAALIGGAKSALCIDGSKAAIEFAAEGAALSGCADRFAAQQGDAVTVMQDLYRGGRSFDTVVCDPPAFAPRKQALDAALRGYQRVALNAAKLVTPGGYLVLCSCSGAVSVEAFREANVVGIGRAGRNAQLLHTGGAAADHPAHPHLDESSYLKAIFFRLD